MSLSCVFRVTAVVLSVAGMASAFLSHPAVLPSSATRPSSGAVNYLPTARTAAAGGRLSMGLADAIPGKLKGAFTKKPKPSARRSRTEGAELYRTLGVTPDADYMEVLAACDRLKVKYAGDRKKIIRADKAKDDIMALRLTQAVAGKIKTSEEATDMNSYLSAKDEYFKKKNTIFQVPQWAQGWFEWPDREHFQQCAYRHGLFAIFAGAFPSAGMSLQMLGGASCFALTMNRNGPDLKRDENGQIAEIRLPARMTTALSAITVLVCVLMGAWTGAIMANIFGEYYLLKESWNGVMAQMCFMAAGSCITTWRDPADGPTVSRRRGKGGRGRD